MKKILLTAVLLGFMLNAVSAFALVCLPVPVSVPVDSPWALIMLVLLISVIALRSVRARKARSAGSGAGIH